MILIVRYQQMPIGGRVAFKLRLLMALVTGCFGMLVVAPAIADETVDFQRQILPLLSDRCFACHGPDGEARQADFRLDQEQGVLEQLTPGSPEESELWNRITADDEDERMPPVDSGWSLDDNEQHLLRRWIEQGARWNQHWSLQPLPKAVDVPQVADWHWPAGDLDRFVLAKLEAAGKTPSKPAARYRWLRRVTLDLTGLPPTVAEIAEFENDDSAAAREKVVDRLLASPRFGQHMAISWLDAARYADSYGYQSDLLTANWPWRDWLVRAINDNLSYDQFLTWQLAGDLLPNPTQDQILATAFNRLHRMTNEGGSLEAEWRHENVVDRVNTLGAAVMGMTLECARCHDHKFDPVTQRDYYNLFSFFNSIDEWGVYFDTSRVPTPSLLLPNWDQQAAIESAAKELAIAKSARDDRRHEFRVGEALAKPDDSDVYLEARSLARFAMDDLEGDKWLTNSVNSGQIGNTGGQNQLVKGRFGNAIRLTGDEPCEFPYLETALNPWERFALSFWIYLPASVSEGVVLHHSGGQDVGYFGTELTLHSGKLQLAMIRFWPGNALAIETSQPVPVEQWVHIVAGNDGSGTAAGLQLFVNGHSETRVLRDQLTKRPDPPGTGWSMGARLQSTGIPGAIVDELELFDRPLSEVEIRLVMKMQAVAPRHEFGAEELFEHDLLSDFRYAWLAQYVADCNKVLLDAQTDVVEISVMQETAEPEPAWVLARGSYNAPRSEDNRAARQTPAILPPLPDDVPGNRLGLARWLVRPDHPLTARVAVNRLWQNFFGSGLVATLNDFGVQGMRPSHGELLDWLARDFIDSAWDVKRFCRQVVLSSTYAQDSVIAPAAREQDPANLLLGRGPSRRLTAEMIRDQALFAAGILDERLDGPPVSPYQPENLWSDGNSMTPAYQQSVGRDLYRRSLYTVMKRSAPMPNMILFDAAEREVCTMSRSRTNTPLQALVLLNDPQFVEAARVLAEKALAGNPEQVQPAIRQMFLQLTSRSPVVAEMEILIQIFNDGLALYDDSPDEVQQLLAVGDRGPIAGLSPAEVAAATMVAQAILNCDAAIWSR